MNEPVEDIKILGIPKVKYLKIAYTLLLVSLACGVLSNLLGFFDMSRPFSGLSAVLGIGGLALVFAAFYAFSEQFSALEIAHFKYIGLLFLGFVVLGMALALVLGGMGSFFNFIGMFLNAAALAVMYAGLRLFERGSEATKDTVIDELKALKSQVQKSDQSNIE